MLVGFCLGDRRRRRWLGGLEGQAHAVLLVAQARPFPLVVGNMDTPSTGPGISGYSGPAASAHLGDFTASPGWRRAPRKRALSRTALLSQRVSPRVLRGVDVCPPRQRPPPRLRRRLYPELAPASLCAPPGLSPPSASVAGGDWAAAGGALQPPSPVRRSQSCEPQPTRTRVFGLQPTWPASARGPLCRHF